MVNLWRMASLEIFPPIGMAYFIAEKSAAKVLSKPSSEPLGRSQTDLEQQNLRFLHF
jgi:hypothetical protein